MAVGAGPLAVMAIIAVIAVIPRAAMVSVVMMVAMIVMVAVMIIPMVIPLVIGIGEIVVIEMKISRGAVGQGQAEDGTQNDGFKGGCHVL